MTNNKNNISILLHEEENNEEVKSNFEINNFLNENENENDNEYNNNNFHHVLHYHENFTMKELLLICNYYGISKQLKINKCNKDLIVQVLVDFETNYENIDIVSKRKNLWFYMNELKNDKFMKKYLLW
jgi:hypothetical protein